MAAKGLATGPLERAALSLLGQRFVHAGSVT